MGQKTKIDWCDSTWNPVTGCQHNCEYCYARGQAKRNPTDKFSWRIGAETAFARLWDEKVKTKQDQGVREVMRPAEVGEWVKIVNKFDFVAKSYKNGDIRRVCKTRQTRYNFDTKSDGWVYLDGEVCATSPTEYVVLE